MARRTESGEECSQAYSLQPICRKHVQYKNPEARRELTLSPAMDLALKGSKMAQIRYGGKEAKLSLLMVKQA